MFNFNKGELSLNIRTNVQIFEFVQNFLKKRGFILLGLILTIIASISFLVFYFDKLGLAYNDARSHLDIGRRVVEGLKPGLAQLGSVWLPLPHILMIPTVWSNFMWHSGLSGALVSMISFVATGILIYLFLKEVGIGLFGRLIGVAIFAANLNVLYLQSTAMTELLLIATMTAGIYELLKWFKTERILNLIQSAFWIMMASLVRYDGWFLFLFSIILIGVYVFRKKGYKASEGNIIFFSTLAGFGIFLWFLWNLLIFKDPLYFIFGPYAAATQQQQLSSAGVLATKGNLLFSIKVYLYALAYNSNAFISVVALIGSFVFFLDRKIKPEIKIASFALFAPLVFNILALYMGQSVLFIQGLSGNTWFNVRYGIVMIPAIAIFTGYLAQKAGKMRIVLVGLTALVLFFSFANVDAVTIDDARVGSSQKNVSEVSGWLAKNTKDKYGFILISAASHDAIIFSSGLPMSKFIHEGTGIYWDRATSEPEHFARWIVMRTNDTSDLTFKQVSKTKAYKQGDYRFVDHYPFADIYELKPQFLNVLVTKPILGNQK